MGSGSGLGTIIGFVVGAVFVIATGGAGAIAWGAVWSGAAIGGLVGGIIGGIIDPMEFPDNSTEAQRLEELQVMGVQEGAGIVKAYGDQIRIAGQLIACSDVHETKHVSNSPTGGGGKKSFLSGTPIRMSNGKDKNIEDIVVGDVVRTAKFAKSGNGKLCYRDREVTHLWSADTKKALRVIGGMFDFTCTPEHEVYGLKPGKDPHWFRASSLREGDKLLSENGWSGVEYCDRFEIEAPTYNLTVKDDHNYFASGVLVKNKKNNSSSSSGQATWYTYDADVVVAICEGPIHKVKEVYFNGKKKYQETNQYPVTVGTDNVTSFDVSWRVVNTGNSFSNPSFKYEVKIEINGIISGIFSDWETGLYAATSGSTNGSWSGETNKKVTSVAENDYVIIRVTGSTATTSEWDGSGYGSFSYTHDHTLNDFGGATASATDSGTISWQSLFSVSDTGAKITAAASTHDTSLVNEFRFYVGDSGDTSDTHYIGNVSTNNHYNNTTPDQILLDANANSPAYRGVAYCAIETLELGDFGNQIPQCQFAIDARPYEPTYNNTATDYATVGQIIDTLMVRQGKYKKNGVGGSYTVGDDFDSDNYQGETTANRVRGFTTMGTKSARQALSTLAIAFDFLISEENGVLRFEPRGTVADVAVDESDLGAFANPESSGNIPIFSQSDKENSELSDEVNVDYFDVNDNYQRGSQKALKSVSGIPKVMKLDVAMGLKSSEAQTIANRVLYQSHQQRKRCAFVLPPKYINVQEADLISLSIKGEGYNIRVLEINRGADFTHEIKGLIEGSESVSYTGDADGDDPVIDTPYTPPLMTTFIIDSVALHDGGIEQGGHYVLACTTTEDKEFKSAEIWTADTSGGLFTLQQSYNNEAMLFTVSSAIPDGPVDIWDDGTEITISLLGPTSSLVPSTVTEGQVLNAESFIYVGGEIIGFKTATVVSGRDVKLTNLIRGRRGTNGFVGTHATNETGCVMSYDGSSGVITNDYGNESIGSYKYYKVVSQGDIVSEVDVHSVLCDGIRMKPSPVGNVMGYKDTDWFVDFNRTDRGFFTLFSVANTPNTDGTESYICKIYDPSDTSTVVRTLSSETDTSNNSGITITQFDATGDITSFPRVTYTDADQQADGTDGLTSIVVEIYKVGAIMSEGLYVQHTITNTRIY